MTNRIKLTKPVIGTRAEAEKTLGEIVELTAEVNALKAILDSDLTAVRQQYEGKIDQRKTAIEAKSGLLQQWAESAPEEFGAKKSVEFLHGRIGFRTGMPKLKTLAGWTWDRVLTVLDVCWIRTKSDPDKEQLLASYAEGVITDQQLRAIGIKVVQEESFFVEPKLEEPSGRITT